MSIHDELTPDEIMDRAADLLDIHGWGHGQLRGETGELCLMGALQMVVYPEECASIPNGITQYSELHWGLVDARRILEQSIERSIISWNDKECTGLDEATEFLRTEAKQYREKTARHERT